MQFQYSEPISRIVLNTVENPFQLVAMAGIEIGLSVLDGGDIDRAEIFIYAGNEVRNCYATFLNERLLFISHCSE